MLVSVKNFEDVVFALKTEEYISLDCETSGLYPYLGDRLFSIIIGTVKTQYYFNFNRYLDFEHEFILPREWIHTLIRSLCANVIFLHNAKFDLGMLLQEGATFLEKVRFHDTESIARLIRSDYDEKFNKDNNGYSLDACAKRIGYEKSDAVMEYLEEHKMFEFEQTIGKKKRSKKYFFDRVPPEVIIPYGKKDAEITYQLGMHQLKQLELQNLYENETALTRVCFAMESRGIRIDRAYCERAKAYELKRCEKAANDFEQLTGSVFRDSNKALAEAFAKMGLESARTEKGNPSFTDSVLKTINHPVAEIVRDYREAYKKAGTYYSNFLGLSDANGILHANIRQSATFTGRFAMSEPNLQNVPKEETGEYSIRQAFIPRQGYTFYELDYKAMEFRLMLEYAGERELCEKIKQGLDPHQATADLVHIERKKAKTLNFGLLYGMGAEKLAFALGVSLMEAKNFRRQYFDALPRVQYFIRQTMEVAKIRGFVTNWVGKKYYFEDPNYCYKAANALIQGGCAEIMKFAMVKIQKHLRGYDAHMLVQVHDSLLLEVAEDSEGALPGVIEIMCSTFKAVYLPMDVSIASSKTSWKDMEEIVV